jgi:CRISPR-associated protein Csd1
LQYIAGDFTDFGGEVTSGFLKDPKEPHHNYLAMLSSWTEESSFGHPKLTAILKYVRQGQVIEDLVRTKLLLVDSTSDGQPKLLKEWLGAKADMPTIFKAITSGRPEDAFVRWRVEAAGSLATGTWEDSALIGAWIGHYASMQTSHGLCMVTGAVQSALAKQHPKKVRNTGDQAKLISSNDTGGFTFRGRFIGADEAAGVGFEATQKAHNSLRWLINRQAFLNGDQVIIAWAISGKPTPDPWRNSMDLFGQARSDTDENDSDIASGDIGQAYALRLTRTIAGYRSNLGDNEDIVVMALDSATGFRLAITYYRELKGSEFFDRVQDWHLRYAWPQNYGKESRFTGAPSPKDVAEAAYGRRLDERLRKSTVERLLPCIIDGLTFPRDLVEATAHRAINRVGLEHWEWEKYLGIACALHRGYFHKRRYEMSLEETRNTRDYLYGRLLAIAEHIESRALYVAGEKRDTTSARLMQRFADRPFSTWRTIELALNPYKARLRTSRAGFLWEMEELLDRLVESFPNEGQESFTNDRSLSGEFLLGYHCQRQALHLRHETTDNATHADILVANDGDTTL